MVKSLGDYNREQASVADVKNIKWTRKNPTEVKKTKNQNKKKISPSNILPLKNVKTKETIEKIYKIKEDSNQTKTKNNAIDKKSKKSSASNSKIKPGFKRPGR